MNWYLEVLRKYAEFGGRSRRTEYWMFALINAVINIVFALAAGQLGASIGTILTIILVVYSLAILIPSLAVGIRRLHDTGRSGWWTLIILIPFLGALVYLFFMVQDSKPGSNAWGPNPKGVAA